MGIEMGMETGRICTYQSLSPIEKNWVLPILVPNQSMDSPSKSGQVQTIPAKTDSFVIPNVDSHSH